MTVLTASGGDDTQQIQDALDVGGVIKLTPGTYQVSYPLHIHKSVSFDGQQTSILNDADFLFDIESNDVLIENLTAVDGDLFYFNTLEQPIERITIRNVHGWGNNTVFETADSEYKLINLTVENCMFRELEDIAVFFTSAWAFIRFQNVTFDYVGTAGAPGSAVQIYDNQGLTFDSVYILGVPHSSVFNGFHFENCQALQIKHCHADSVGGNGFVFINNLYSKIHDNTASLVGNNGIIIDNERFSHICNNFVQGRGHIEFPTGIGFYVTSTTTQDVVIKNNISREFVDGYWMPPSLTNSIVKDNM